MWICHDRCRCATEQERQCASSRALRSRSITLSIFYACCVRGAHACRMRIVCCMYAASRLCAVCVCTPARLLGADRHCEGTQLDHLNHSPQSRSDSVVSPVWMPCCMPHAVATVVSKRRTASAVDSVDHSAQRTHCGHGSLFVRCSPHRDSVDHSLTAPSLFVCGACTAVGNEQRR